MKLGRNQKTEHFMLMGKALIIPQVGKSNLSSPRGEESQDRNLDIDTTTDPTTPTTMTEIGETRMNILEVFHKDMILVEKFQKTGKAVVTTTKRGIPTEKVPRT